MKIRISPRRTLALFVPLLLSLSGFSQTVWYVDSAAPAGGDGMSWASAFDSLQPALDAASTSEHVWVAAGTYYPTERSNPSNPRSARFLVSKPIRLFGGFHGNESSVAERDPDLFDQTILSADIGVPGDASDNAYRVVSVESFDVSGIARINGFRITGGNAIGSGGGLRCKISGAGANPRVTLTQCLLNENNAARGGAIAAEDFGIVRLVRCVVTGNTATTHGGAAYCFTGGVSAVNTQFVSNKAANRGGALYADSTAAGLIVWANCLVSNNSARFGGAVFLEGSSFTSGVGHWYNSTFTDNGALERGGAFFVQTNATTPGKANVFNSILWGNAAPESAQIHGAGQNVRYSDVEGSYAGIGNVDVDPLFLVGARPSPGSPVNDAGSNALVAEDFLDLDGDGNTSEESPFDLRDRSRRLADPLAPDSGEGTSPIVGMGAYEVHPFDAVR